ncbi:hypothetical protein R50073_33780 [Maricurvus nonylphenolicus]
MRTAYFTLLLLCLITRVEATAPIQLGINASGSPWVSTDEEEPSGIAIELMHTVFGELDTEINMSILPITRLYALTGNHQLDGAVILDAPGLSRPQGLACSKTLLSIPYGLYLSADQFPENQPIPWDKLNVGGFRISYLPLAQVSDITHYQDFSLPSQIFKSIKAGRINGAASSPVNVAYWNKKLGLKLTPRKLFGHVNVILCFSHQRLGSKADELAMGVSERFFHIIDHKPEAVSAQAIKVFRLFDARNPPKTLLRVE